MTQLDLLEDPQRDLDEEIKGSRGRHVRPLRERYWEWARGAEGTAVKRRVSGDSYLQELALCRAAVYWAAATILDAQSAQDAAAEMMMRARMAAPGRTPPLVNFDAAGLSYVAARAWQKCAWAIDPALPEVQPPWD